MHAPVRRVETVLPVARGSALIPVMGAKYLPSVKDHKASQRYQHIQQRKARAAAPASAPPKPGSAAKKSGKG
jgi:hypothetical protein